MDSLFYILALLAVGGLIFYLARKNATKKAKYSTEIKKSAVPLTARQRSFLGTADTIFRGGTGDQIRRFLNQEEYFIKENEGHYAFTQKFAALKAKYGIQ